MTTPLVATKNDLTQLLFASGFVDEAKLLRPDAVKLNTTRSGFDKLFRRITEGSLNSKIRIFKQNPVVGFDALFADREVHLVGSRERGQTLLGFVTLFYRTQRIL